MRLEDSFNVPVPAEQVWSLLNDVPRVIPCMPGAELTEVIGNDAWTATMHVKLGPISLKFLSDVVREKADDDARRVVLNANGRDASGRGSARAKIESSLTEDEGGTTVAIVTELTLQGTIAQFGRGVVGDVSAQLTKKFAECLANQLVTAPPGPQATTNVAGANLHTATSPSGVRPIGGFSLFLRALRGRFLPLRGRSSGT